MQFIEIPRIANSEAEFAQLQAEETWVVDHTPGLSKEEACKDAVEKWEERLACAFAYRVAKAAYENAEEDFVEPEAGLAQQERSSLNNLKALIYG